MQRIHKCGARMEHPAVCGQGEAATRFGTWHGVRDWAPFIRFDVRVEERHEPISADVRVVQPSCASPLVAR